ncbi:hypothetical protein LG296_21205 (plasmid) [Ureibacillus chungkukjangi]|uniref:hypothetical protein n=1 Tax=Ureibacillus chungkukjangi TaxID=1202712 RepID=UPI000D34F3C5|nr:hypothetical protein [Ureibacillus chungkukjangi]MCM3390207.1 hypothetical protein [Ureibacillus chungkukjangi]
MKITDFLIIFFILYVPTLFYIEAKAENTQTFVELNQKHENSMTVAAQDAVNVLRTNVIPKLEVGYDSYKINPVDPQPAIDTFLQTLALNYQVNDSVTVDMMSRYIPVFAVVDYDGLLLNVYQKYTNEDREQELDRVWLPKIPFSYNDDEGNIINFTIDEDIEVYDVQLNEWFEGKRSELVQEVTVPLLNNETDFEQIRKRTIVDTLQENIAFYINEHNVYTKYLDVTYQFMMPLIAEEDWYNTVDDVSILAFFQGYPYQMADQVYHEYAFVGTRLHKKESIVAGMVDGQKRFWYESCNYPYVADEKYPNKKSAAAAGYSELSCLNP